MRRFGLGFALAWSLFAPTMAHSKDAAPSAAISWPGGSGEAKFRAYGDIAFLTLRTRDGKETTLRAVASVDDALAILADDRLAFAWPALLNWAGSDLHSLRDFAVAHAKANLDAQLHPPPAGRYSRPVPDEDTKLEATRNYIKALFRAGRREEAIALARHEIASPTASKVVSFAKVSYTTLLAGMLFDDGRQVEALALLEKTSADGSIRSTWRQNNDINLAAFLAKAGLYDRALSTVDRTYEAFEKERTGMFSGFFYTVTKMSGAEAQFAWIRACALSGLGRQAEGDAIMASMGGKFDSSPAMAILLDTRLRGYRCMHDAQHLADELTMQLPSAPPAGDIFLQLQPAFNGYPPERETTEAALAKLSADQLKAAHVRILGAQFAAAIQGWSSAVTPSAP